MLDAVDRRRVADDDGRAVLGREPRAAVRDGRCGQGGRGDDPPRRRVQAADQPVRLPGPGRPGASATSPRHASEPGLPVITEVMEPSQVDIVAEYADILQIGTRNMQNYSLLRDVGRVARPVMLKRGYGATVEEWLMAAEYIVSSGNPNVILCERGIRTFETYTRNTMDLAAVPLAPPPDPPAGHRRPERTRPASAGWSSRWPSAAWRSVRTGSWSRSTRRPDEALSDAEQQLTLDQFRDMMAALVPVHEHVRSLHGDPMLSGAELGIGGGGGPGQALSSTMASTDDRRGSARGRTRARPLACAATCACPATSRSATARCMLAALADGREPHRRRRRWRRRPLDRRDRRARSAPPSSALRDDGRTVDYRVVSPGADGLTRAATRPRLRQLRDDPAPDRRTARRAADDRHPRRRRFVAPPTGRSYHRATALDGRGAPRPTERLPPTTDRGRSYPAPVDRLPRRRCRARR